jgi:hypothetical protein
VSVLATSTATRISSGVSGSSGCTGAAEDRFAGDGALPFDVDAAPGERWQPTVSTSAASAADIVRFTATTLSVSVRSLERLES